jgi:hypothetical protein
MSKQDKLFKDVVVGDRVLLHDIMTPLHGTTEEK